MSDNLTLAYTSALDAMTRPGPKGLHQLAAVAGDDDNLSDGTALVTHLTAAGPEDPLRQQLAHALAGWDRVDTDAAWATGTKHNTAERRDAVLSALRLDPQTRELFQDRFPYATTAGTIVIADDWEQWRTADKQHGRDFYWAHYSKMLKEKGWDPDAVAELDAATEEVVGRLSDPTRTKAYQAKGLVVGYVQSGKTANFTGVIARAVDAGYRLVIVLTGTTNMLRAQTQRRLDTELLGRDNIILEMSTHDTRVHEYEDDPDWVANRFVQHGGRPSDAGYPDIRRLSTHTWDYKRLQQGFTALEYHRRQPSRRLIDPSNLFTTDARLVVAKKNKTVLENLVADLGRISERLGEVPVLIIDDESDQASVNTVSPKKWENDRSKRTTINKLIGQLLSMMPRAQYVGYTATPYANVFIDPDDSQDIFPTDFLLALDRPRAYMGAEDFHDFDADTTPIPERSITESNERRHVRLVREEPEDDKLREALDMYVLTGAVKLHRQRLGRATYQHHTMLVHIAMDRESHRDAAASIVNLWNSAAYRSPAGLARLRSLYESDVLPVSQATAADLPTPVDFDELRQDIGEALSRISPPGRDSSPVIVVNSDTDLERQQESLDFDRRPVWRILIGGNKLARGFTVEGLTVTYYRRATAQTDTLMQMGRWFGFRPKYRDLVRLYTTAELHQLFAAACMDEDFLRTELRRYAKPVEGVSQLTPRQIPPLIAQHRPDLRPTSRNKMWNARLVERSSPGEPMEPVAYVYPDTAARKKATLSNNRAWEPVMAAASTSDTFSFRTVRSVTVDGKTVLRAASTQYDANVTEVDHPQMLAILGKLTWSGGETLKPELAWLNTLRSDQLNSWVVIFPHQSASSSSRQMILGHGPFTIFKRARTLSGNSIRAISENRHRNAARRIAGLLKDTVADENADELYKPATGALIMYPSVPDMEKFTDAESGVIPDDRITIGFHLVTPMSTMPLNGKLIKWQVRNSSDPTAVVVDAEE